MTVREWWNEIPLKVVILVVGGAVAVAALQAQVSRMDVQKADQSEIARLERKIDAIVAVSCNNPPPTAIYPCKLASKP